jgi:hypothetical protein
LPVRDVKSRADRGFSASTAGAGLRAATRRRAPDRRLARLLHTFAGATSLASRSSLGGSGAASSPSDFPGGPHPARNEGHAGGLLRTLSEPRFELDAAARRRFDAGRRQRDVLAVREHLRACCATRGADRISRVERNWRCHRRTRRRRTVGRRRLLARDTGGLLAARAALTPR